MVAFLKEKPCKIIDITTSKTGKHGHAKANITGIDIFTGKKVAILLVNMESRNYECSKVLGREDLLGVSQIL